MSNLRLAAQQALEALEQYKGVVVTLHDPESFRRMEVDSGQAARAAIAALREALAEPDYWQEEARRYAGNADYWRKRYKALSEPDSDYERGFVDGMNLQTKGSVDKAVNRMAQTTHWEGCEAVHPECKAKTELERKSDAIQRLWKERDELRSETRTLVRQNGEWQELNAELVEALRRCRDMVAHPDNLAFIDAALAKVEASNGS